MYRTTFAPGWRGFGGAWAGRKGSSATSAFCYCARALAPEERRVVRCARHGGPGSECIPVTGPRLLRQAVGMTPNTTLRSRCPGGRSRTGWVGRFACKMASNWGRPGPARRCRGPPARHEDAGQPNAGMSARILPKSAGAGPDGRLALGPGHLDQLGPRRAAGDACPACRVLLGFSVSRTSGHPSGERDPCRATRGLWRVPHVSGPWPPSTGGGRTDSSMDWMGL